MFDSNKADEFLSSVKNADVMPYIRYWADLVPRCPRDVWKRWVFSFMSIHTSWKANVAGYNAVTSLPSSFTKRQLEEAIITSGVGLHKIRTKGVWEFTHKFRKTPHWFQPQSGESMTACRDRLAKHLFGIGMAKTSFVFEMLYPVSCGVVCLDTHILQLYGVTVPGTPKKEDYHAMENHWRTTCCKHGLPPPIARHIFWDRKQGYPDNSYWAHCLAK